jgi:hypothetical protein
LLIPLGLSFRGLAYLIGSVLLEQGKGMGRGNVEARAKEFRFCYKKLSQHLRVREREGLQEGGN